MYQPLAPVIPLRTPSRVPTPGDAPAAAAQQHYEGDPSDHYLPLTSEEKVVVAHLRGWAHFGPLCRLCGGGR